MIIADENSDAQEFSERLDAFYAGETPVRVQRDLSNGISDEDWRQREAAKQADIIAEMDLLLDYDPDQTEAESDRTTFIAPQDATDASWERIDHEPVMTPYDKARAAVAESESLSGNAEPDSVEFHRAMSDKADANLKLKTETKRGLDDGWRKRRAIDVHRAGEGREEYNVSRRKKRNEPNERLSDMSPEQQKEHRRVQKAKSAYTKRKEMLGWTPGKIVAGWTVLQAKKLLPN